MPPAHVKGNSNDIAFSALVGKIKLIVRFVIIVPDINDCLTEGKSSDQNGM